MVFVIEAAESCVLAGQLEKELRGKTIEQVITNSSPHKFAFYFEDSALYEERLIGKQIGTVDYFGGYVEIHAEDMRIQLSENPKIRYFQKEGQYPDKHQLCLIFDDGSRLYVGTQMYAVIFVCRDGENQNPYYAAAKNAISPLSDRFDYYYFKTLAANAKGNLSLKAFLATEQRIPGIGNGVIQDILFLSKLHPKEKIRNLTEEQWQFLFAQFKKTLAEMAAKGGRDTEKDIYGQAGGYQTYLSAKTLQEPCPVCARDLVKQTYLGGAIYFCPNCQPLSE